MIVFPDPWDALCLAEQLPGRAVAAYDAPGAQEAFARIGVSPILVAPPEELLTLTLLNDSRVEPGDEAVLCFKPSARLEATGYRFALAPAAIAQGIENKLTLPALAGAAGAEIAKQGRVRVGAVSFDEIVAEYGLPAVAQSPRGFAGRRTFKVSSKEDWASVEAALPGRPAKVAAWAAGQPGTSNAVVDGRGRVMVSAPILQLTGEPDLTPHLLGSCGNDFTWRPDPHPGEAPARLAEALGPVLAERGYRGHFGIDWVWDGERCTLIEINARLTASFGLYVRSRPELLEAHLAALDGQDVEPRRLEPFEGGQLVVYNTGVVSLPPLAGPACWPSPGREITPGSKRGRRIVEGALVDRAGRRLVDPPA